MIVTSSVSLKGNISGEEKHFHANSSCTEQETERCLITSELTHFNLPWTIDQKKKKPFGKKTLIRYLQYPFFPSCGLFSTAVNGLHQTFSTLRMCAAVHTPEPA